MSREAQISELAEYFIPTPARHWTCTGKNKVGGSVKKFVWVVLMMSFESHADVAFSLFEKATIVGDTVTITLPQRSLEGSSSLLAVGSPALAQSAVCPLFGLRPVGASSPYQSTEQRVRKLNGEPYWLLTSFDTDIFLVLKVDCQGDLQKFAETYSESARQKRLDDDFNHRFYRHRSLR